MLIDFCSILAAILDPPNLEIVVFLRNNDGFSKISFSQITLLFRRFCNRFSSFLIYLIIFEYILIMKNWYSDLYLLPQKFWASYGSYFAVSWPFSFLIFFHFSKILHFFANIIFFSRIWLFFFTNIVIFFTTIAIFFANIAIFFANIAIFC